MKKILLVEDSSIIIVGLVHILKEIGFDQSYVDAVNSFDGMLTMIGNNDYEMVFFGLKIYQNKNLPPLLEVVQKKSASIFIIFGEIPEINTQKKIYWAGVKGIVSKKANSKEISFAIQRVLDNELYIDSASLLKLLYTERENKKINSILTKREKEVAGLLAHGKSNMFIGNILNIMPTTVSTFKTKIFTKLNVQNILELKEWESQRAVEL